MKLLLFVGVLGAATTMVAMEYFLFSFDNSSDMKKVFWFWRDTVPTTWPRSLLKSAEHAFCLGGKLVGKEKRICRSATLCTGDPRQSRG